MLRGAIEGVTHDAIFGWLYSPEVPLRGRTVLAFLDGRCIGSGRIEVFRQDLKDARLGDGFCGFHFGLTYPGRAEPGRVVVKLEASDAVLLQSGSRVAAGR